MRALKARQVGGRPQTVLVVLVFSNVRASEPEKKTQTGSFRTRRLIVQMGRYLQ